MLPGLESYLSGEYSGYAQLVAAPQYPHACESFDHPARYSVTLSAALEKSLLLVVLRGRVRAEEVSWRVYVNEVKVSRVFKPQHAARLHGEHYYAYVADVTPVVRGSASAELMIKCHAPGTYVEAAGFVSLIPSESRSLVEAYMGLANVADELSINLSSSGFSMISMLGRGRGGAISISGVSREVSGPFELSELVTSGNLRVRGPLGVYALVANKYPGTAPDVATTELSDLGDRLRVVLLNPGDYGVRNVDVRLMRGGMAISRVTLSHLKPRESAEVLLEKLANPPTSVKITFEFSGSTFVRVLQLGSPK